MTVRVAINGFGRIGRNILRAIVECGRKDIQVVAINDLGPVETNAHLLALRQRPWPLPAHRHRQGRHHRRRLRPDQSHRRARPGQAAAQGHEHRHRDGMHRHLHVKEKASAHLTAGAKRVLVSAPCDGADLTVVYGVNHDKLTKDHLVLSNASCTTNCLAPVAKVLNDAVGIEKGFMTTIHAYTGDQPTLDTMHKDLYRGRAASLSMIPTTTGAAKAVGLVLPELNGKLDGTSIRVPTPNVSVVDFKFIAKRADQRAEINEAILARRQQSLKGILGTTDQPNVSMDFNHDAAFVDLPPRPDQGHGRHARPRPLLVRQRVGLLQPHERHRRRAGEDDLIAIQHATRKRVAPAALFCAFALPTVDRVSYRNEKQACAPPA